MLNVNIRHNRGITKQKIQRDKMKELVTIVRTSTYKIEVHYDYERMKTISDVQDQIIEKLDEIESIGTLHKFLDNEETEIITIIKEV